MISLKKFNYKNSGLTFNNIQLDDKKIELEYN